MTSFAARLRQLRAREGLRQKDLAAHLGLAQTTIANYEQGSRFPDEKTMYKMADHFHVTLDYLLGRAEVNLLADSPGHGRSFFSDRDEDLEPLSPLARSYLETLLGGDREEAGRIVFRALERGETIQDVYLKVFERALKEVGRLWAASELDVGTEHFVTASTQAIMSQLYPQLMAGAQPRGSRTCLVFAVCGEFHEVGARMVADLLGRDGWHCLFLGGNLCNDDILRSVGEHKPDLLALSASLYLNVDSVARLIRTVRGERTQKDLKILVGGRPFNLEATLWQRVGADGFARTAAEAVSAAETLVSRDPVPAGRG